MRNTLITALFLGVLAFYSDLSAQSVFDKSKAIVLTPDKINESDIKSILKDHRAKVDLSEINEIRENINTHNNDIDRKISESIQKRIKLYNLNDKLLRLRQKVSLISRLDSLQKSNKDIIKRAFKNIKSIPKYGLFLYVKKTDEIFADQTNLAENAKEKVARVAIEDILGSIIKSVKEDFYNNFGESYSSYIEETVKGEFALENAQNNFDNKSGLFYYIAVVKVTPLEGNVSLNEVAVKSNKDYFVYDLMEFNKLNASIDEFADFDVPNKLIEEFITQKEMHKMTVINKNINSKGRGNKILNDAKENVTENLYEIEQTKTKIENLKQELYSITSKHTKLNYKKKNLSEQELAQLINDALDEINTTIKKYEQKEVRLQEQKYQLDFDNNLLSTSGDYAKNASEEIIALKKQFENDYGRYEQYVYKAVLNNDIYKNYEGKTINHNKKIEEIVVFVRTADNGLELYYIAKFNITGLRSDETYTKTDKVTFTDFTETAKGLNMQFVAVKGGTFTMGCTSEQSNCENDEKPAHKVTVSNFYMGKYEVTQAQWRAVMGASSNLSNPSYFKDCDNCPVEKVSWNDIQEFIKKLNQITGKKYRLPTEAEWEYAARGGNGVGTIHESSLQTQYAGSNNINEVAWYWKNSGDKVLNGEWDYDKMNNNNCKTHPVGQKKPNELGIYDMSGNVYEWCSDWYGSDYYSNSPQNNPQGPTTGSNRVLRGGSWFNFAGCCRVAFRNRNFPVSSSSSFGFRLVLLQ